MPQTIVAIAIAVMLLAGCVPATHSPAQAPPSPMATGPTGQDMGAAKDGAGGGKAAPASITIKSNGAGASEAELEKVEAVLDEALDFCQTSQDYWQEGDLESALEALDKAYSLILNLELESDSPLFQQKEDLRFTIAKRIMEVYASRHVVSRTSPRHTIPLDMNRHVEAEIHSFTVGAEKDFFVEAYKRSGRYRPLVQKMLKEAGLPRELVWLPLIESGFKVSALSKARALGLWQFIASTGHRFGLKRNLYIDERMDPVKSTQAAIGYLKELHQLFGDWTTVLAGYNCGEYRVLRVISSQKINYLDNFWDLYEKLPQETARYVPRFLATLHILKNPQQYGLDIVKPEEPIEFETVTITRQIKLKDIAERLSISEEELRALNPELRYHVLPDDAYELRVPPGQGDVLLASLEAIPVSAKPQEVAERSASFEDIHQVKKGETLASVAKKYGVNAKALMMANGLKKNVRLAPGKTLKIPKPGPVATATTPSAAVPPSPKAKASETTVYVVKPGDSVYNIARRYNTTVHRLLTLNRIAADNLQVGQKVRIPSREAETETPAQPRTYQVKNGDTPFTIAQNHNMTLERLLKLNRLSPRSTIHPGQALMVD